MLMADAFRPNYRSSRRTWFADVANIARVDVFLPGAGILKSVI